MRTIIETEHRIGEVSKTYRTIHESSPWYWRVAMWLAFIEVTGTAAFMVSLIGIAVAKRHGWL